MLEPSQWSFPEASRADELGPSWVPRYDLRCDIQGTHPSTLAMAPLYRAHDGFPSVVQSLPLSLDQDCLLVGGLNIDQVESVVARFDAT